MQEELRKSVKMLKVLQGVTYTELADLLEIRRNSFYNWLKGQYDFSPQRATHLRELIELIKE